MNTLESWLLAYLFNSIWQVPLVFLAAALVCRIALRCTPGMKHRFWVTALVLEAALPASSLAPARSIFAYLQFAPRMLGLGRDSHDTQVTVMLGAGRVHGALGLPDTLLVILTAAYLSALFYFAARLLCRLWRTHGLRLRARRAVLEGSFGQKWDEYRMIFRVPDAEIGVSREICGPVTIGVRHRLVLLPEEFASTLLDEDREAALAHEFTHMQRRDFGLNLLYQFLSLPIAYHPLLRLTLAHVAETREMVCDALAADAVAGPERYARSLLRLASAFIPATPTSTLHAIGIFDANTLERRIMTLKSGRMQLRFGQRLAIGATSMAIVLGTCASAMALRMSVASPALQDTTQTPEQGSAAHVASGVMAGNILFRVNPVYPQEAKDARIQGTVVLSARIGTDGSIESLKLISGPSELAPSAREAVRQWTYKPYLLNGNPVAVDTTINVTYSLND